MPWVKAISVQRNVNTTFKFIHFYYNILYAIEKLHQDITLNLKDVVPKTFTKFWLLKVFLRKTMVKQV